jgi:hypothetical protein
MVVSVETGEDGSPTGGTQGSCHISVFEMNSFCCETIHIGSLQKRMPEKAHGIVTVVISQDDQDVRPLCQGRKDKERKECDQKAPQVHGEDSDRESTV